MYDTYDKALEGVHTFEPKKCQPTTLLGHFSTGHHAKKISQVVAFTFFLGFGHRLRECIRSLPA